MGLFLEVAILKGSTLAEITEVLPELSAEHPEMNLHSAIAHHEVYADGISVSFSAEVVGYEPLAKALSAKLMRLVMLLYMYDGDHWGYYLYENGRKLDAFHPIPGYFKGEESDQETASGNVRMIARRFGVPASSIQNYLVRWAEGRGNSGKKAYPEDQFAYGDCWQMVDFMKALRYPYVHQPQEKATAAASSPKVAATADTALITNELERWIADTYALWSGRGGGNWQLFGGYPKNADNAYIMEKQLKRDWEIQNLEEGIHTVNLLVADKAHQTPETDGWDFCRGMQLIGVFYLVGYLDREQMITYSCTVGKIIQRHFQSWDALCQSYLTGYESWCRKNFNSVEAEEGIAERRAIYEKYKKMKDGPYKLPWDMPLDPSSKGKSICESSSGKHHFDQWLAQEEKWVGAYRQKTRKLLLWIGFATVIFMAAFLMGLGLVDHVANKELILAGILGAVVGLVIMLPIYWYVMRRLGKACISKALIKAVKTLEMDELEQEKLGMEMLDALQSRGSHIDYVEQFPHSQKTPARLMVSKNFFYQTGIRMEIILIRRRDVDYAEKGTEKQRQGVPAGNVQSFPLHTIYFYYRSTRERRLEGSVVPDNSMSFLNPAIRDKAFSIIDRQLKMPEI